MNALANAQGRLGRGLSALLGDTNPNGNADPNGGVDMNQAPMGDPNVAPMPFPPHGPLMVGVAQLERNPDQPRKTFDENELQELSDSIRAKGVLQPIVVRPLPGVEGSYQIVAGERRWRAAQQAGLHDVPVVVRDLTDQEVLEIGLIENVQRADLNPLEEAAAYEALIAQFGHTQEVVAQAVGKSRSHIANCLRLLGLPSRVQDLVRDGKLSAGHARAIATSDDIERLAQHIVDKGLSVREAEALAKGPTPVEPNQTADDMGVAQPAPPAELDIAALAERLSGALGLGVKVKSKANGTGEVRVSYQSLDQLQDVCRRLGA